MTFGQLIKGALFHFKDLKAAKKTPFWKSVVYLLILSLFLAIPTVYQAVRVTQDIKSDSLKIAKKIPDFTIKNGAIKTKGDSEGFIYQTNSIILTFDPEGKRSEEDVTHDLVGNFFSVGLLKDQAILVLPDYGGVSTSLFGDNVLKSTYNKEPLKEMTGAKLRHELRNWQIPWWAPLVMLLVAIYPAFLNLLLTVFITAIGGIILAKVRLKQITFFETFKTLIFCSTIPVLLSAILLLFRPNFDFSLLITFISIFIFARIVGEYDQMDLPGM